jgi:hypothetical protein
MEEWRAKNWQKVKLKQTHRGMIDRCHNPERMKRWGASAGIAGAWRDYGAAGVTVCPGFRDPERGLAEFTRVMGDPPSRLETCDRIDPGAGYFCGGCEECRGRGMEGPNVRWASKAIQDANRKNSRFITGLDPKAGERVTLTLNEWGRRLGLSPRTIAQRLEKVERGDWPVERLLDPRRWIREDGSDEEATEEVCPF